MTEVAYTIEATFTPSRLETLRPRAQPFIGHRMRLTRAWVITERDGGPYVGQTAWLPDTHEIGWVPDEDLSEVTVLRTMDFDGV